MEDERQPAAAKGRTWRPALRYFLLAVLLFLALGAYGLRQRLMYHPEWVKRVVGPDHPVPADNGYD